MAETVLCRLRFFLRQQGIPGPFPILTLEGSGFFVPDGTVYSLTPWVEGRPYAVSWLSLEAAGRLLARFHQACRLYPEPEEIQRVQGEVYSRDPMAWHHLRQAAARGNTDFDRMALELISQADARSWGHPYSSLELPLQLGHFDWNPGNLLFDPAGDRIAGLLDYDLVRVAERVRDVAIGMHRFGRIRPDVGSCADALSGTMRRRCERFLAGYESLECVSAHERKAIPAMLYDEARRKIQYILGKHYFKGDTSSDFDLEKQALHLTEIDELAKEMESENAPIDSLRRLNAA